MMNTHRICPVVNININDSYINDYELFKSPNPFYSDIHSSTYITSYSTTSRYIQAITIV